MIALDANILVYCHRRDSEWYERALPRVRVLAENRAPWAIPWPCIHEFFAAVTHPRVFPVPTPIEAALDQIDALLQSPSLVLLSETEGYWQHLNQIVKSGRVVGPLVHDARIAALCLQHGVTELWTADRDFGRFPALTVRNPLID